MSRDRSRQFVDATMDSEDVERLLESQGYGIISLCDAGDPYSIPVSFGYDGDVVYVPFLLTEGDTSKTDFIEEGTVARLLVTDIQDMFNWKSVSITDTVQSVATDGAEWDQFIDTLVENGWFRDQFEEASAIESIQGWKLGLSNLESRERRSISYE